MSEENVEIVRGIYERWEQGDFSNVDWADPEIEFQMPKERPVRGLAAMGERWSDWLGMWDGVAISGAEFFDIEDRVAAVHMFRGSGKRSGIPAADFSGGCVFTLRKGKVMSLHLYGTRADALEAAGLQG